MFSIQFDSSIINGVFSSLQGQIPFATSLALNRTAQVVKEELKREMRSVFDRPTPFVMESLRIIPSDKRHLEAKVWFKNPPKLRDKEHYLAPQVYGGSRSFKGAERLLQMTGHLPQGWFAVPGPAARLDGYGNMSRGQIVQILSALRSLPSGIGNRPLQYGTTRGSRAPRNMPNFVVIQPGRGSALKPGVWLRGPNRSINLVLAFVSGVSYRKRFDFFETAQRVTERELARQFDQAFKDARATSWHRAAA
ncbi:MAG: hypothetical protein HQL80_06585 [Magnetococcales bacterium]|nr:hypothetical protein [Magnetococcales bacterium]